MYLKPGGGGGVGGANPQDFVHPLAILFHPLAWTWNVDDVTRAMSKGGVLVNVQEGGGCFSIFRRADDVTRTMSKGGWCL